MTARRHQLNNQGSALNQLNDRGSALMSVFRRCVKIARLPPIGAPGSAGMPRREGFALTMPSPDRFLGALRLALESLGPTFVKFGQLLSTRSDITPPQVQQELSKLQDHAPSMPQAVVVAELERSLKAKSNSLFASVEMAPMACGSDCSGT